ncbi:MAG: putative DNA binding domain-containing protein, partial [Chloroflexi bacterium]|nr:putative DNA binding domain-containing protein [Chloroflexota bacterium]
TRPYRRSAQPFDHVEAARKQGPSIVQSFHEGMTRRGGRLHAVLRDVVAFANTNGGTIYVGVGSNPKVPVKGVENVQEETKTLLEEIERLVMPPINVEVSVLKSQGKDVLRIVVPKGEDPPYVLEGSNIYIRQEDETSLAMRDEIVALIRRALVAKEGLVLAEAGQKEVPALAPAVPQPQAAMLDAAEQEREPRPAPATAQPARRRQRPSPQPALPASHETAESTSLTAPKQETVSSSSPDGVERPRTGVEIVDSEERKGTLYHTMCDLRDGGLVHNVTRSSARRLWRYAIALKEKGTFEEHKVDWRGNLGLWHKYLRAGKPHYDLVQRTPDGQIHVYYGVTEEGIHGPWKAVVGEEE